MSVPGEPDLPDEPGTVDVPLTGGEGLVRSSGVVAVGTGLSRLTGLLRTVALAYAVGTTFLAESYNLANTTPNMVYDLLLGGILSATLIPVFVDNVRRHDDEAIGRGADGRDRGPHRRDRRGHGRLPVHHRASTPRACPPTRPAKRPPSPSRCSCSSSPRCCSTA